MGKRLQNKYLLQTKMSVKQRQLKQGSNGTASVKTPRTVSTNAPTLRAAKNLQQAPQMTGNDSISMPQRRWTTLSSGRRLAMIKQSARTTFQHKRLPKKKRLQTVMSVKRTQLKQRSNGTASVNQMASAPTLRAAKRSRQLMTTCGEYSNRRNRRRKQKRKQTQREEEEEEERRMRRRHKAEEGSEEEESSERKKSEDK